MAVSGSEQPLNRTELNRRLLWQEQHLACAEVFVRFPPYEQAENEDIFSVKKTPYVSIPVSGTCFMLMLCFPGSICQEKGVPGAGRRPLSSL